jgi:hypothetical protein
MGAKWIARGRAFLEATPEAPSKAARTWVRIYYRSEGGETLCVEAGPLTWQAADALTSGLRATYQRWSVTRCICHGREGCPPPPVKTGARLVKFPSQSIC